MKWLLPLCIGISFLIFACDTSSESNEESQEVANDSTIVYGKKDFLFPQLTETAEAFVSSWGVYTDFETEAKAINGRDLEQLKSGTDRLLARTDSLSKKIPDTLLSQAIISRITVAKTRASLVHQEAHKVRVDSAALVASIHEMNMATKNLIVQINEKFKKDDIDLQRKESEKEELKKQQKFLDSVYKAELQDKKNDTL
ncbi:hypothetical protein [Cochleicola gelatinilyticus]|uniref:Lipoprotein n=1 Tax=Cochleicola gelatinilyticus TaxID=1763537 RepID=A0A167IY06_9FLAO|nr:hypothetical protein [Cochleicola gelatinilyticus]OAB80124.1 hypothetical protein ULVI_05135 [Cochleicola gelatinilyticus]